MKDYKLKLRKLRASRTLGWWNWNTLTSVDGLHSGKDEKKKESRSNDVVLLTSDF